MSNHLQSFIQAAQDSLNLRLKDLPQEKEKILIQEVREHFVKPSLDSLWWWEHFKQPGTSHHFPDGTGFRFLMQIVPNPAEPVWLLVGPDTSQRFCMFEGPTEIIQQVIGECPAFEYYLIAHELDWLVCENHHNVVIAIGTEVEKNLQCLKGSPHGLSGLD